MEMALGGLTNLRSTYQNDVVASTALDLLKERVEAYIMEMKQKCPCLQDPTLLEQYESLKRETNVAALVACSSFNPLVNSTSSSDSE